MVEVIAFLFNVPQERRLQNSFLLFEEKQETQCTCKVTLSSVHKTTVAVEKQKYYIFLSVCVCVCVCVCLCASALLRMGSRARWRVRVRARVWPCLPSMQSVCTILYCHPRPLWFQHIFPHYFINSMIFEKETLTAHKMCLIFSTSLSATFLIPRRIERNFVVNAKTSSCEIPVILVKF